MKRENKDIKKIKVEHLQNRNTISKMKNTLDENNPDAEQKSVNLKTGIETIQNELHR